MKKLTRIVETMIVKSAKNASQSYSRFGLYQPKCPKSLKTKK